MVMSGEKMTFHKLSPSLPIVLFLSLSFAMSFKLFRGVEVRQHTNVLFRVEHTSITYSLS